MQSCSLRPPRPLGLLGRLGIYPLTLRLRHVLSHSRGVPSPDFSHCLFSFYPSGGLGSGPLLGWVELALLLLVRTPGAVQSLSAPGVCAPLAPPGLLYSIGEWGFGGAAGPSASQCFCSPIGHMGAVKSEHARAMHAGPCRLRDAIQCARANASL